MRRSFSACLCGLLALAGALGLNAPPDDSGESMDVLAARVPEFAAALAAFDAGRFAEAAQAFEPLRGSADADVAAAAEYFHVRALVARGLFEEALAILAPDDPRFGSRDDQTVPPAAGQPTSAPASSTSAPVSSPASSAQRPFAPQRLFLQAACQAGVLRFEDATATLAALQEQYPEAPEAVRLGARQLLLEIERREIGTLEEVATLMGYSAGRLRAADTSPRLRTRQEEIIARLDQLIQAAEQDEQQQNQQGASGRRSARANPQPRQGAPESVLPESGPGRIGELHRAPVADPGAMWGKLPPAEREQILQALRERYPSRYRQLVEQYYRSLAEEE